jgi:beta-1,4-mannosyltransferase
MADAMKVLMIPARRNSGTNPYTALMTSALEAAGCVIDDFSARRFWRDRHDAVHIHWPHVYAGHGCALMSSMRCLAFIALLRFKRLQGAAVIWTVHDVQATSGKRPLLMRFLMRGVTSTLDGAVFLSKSSISPAICAHKRLAAVESIVVPHGLYGTIYPRAARAEARKRFNVDVGSRVIGFIGDIKPYKGLESLLALYESANEELPVLLIAGKAPPWASTDFNYGAVIRRLVDAGKPIVWFDQRLTESDMALGLAACDLIVAPYHASWNSGIATLALEHERPLLCPDFPIFRELQAEVGSAWIHLFEHPISALHLRRALGRISPVHDASADQLESFKSRRQWPTIAENIVELYRRLRSKRQRAAPADRLIKTGKTVALDMDR